MLQQSFVLFLHLLNLDLFLGNFFSQKLHTRRFSTASSTQTFVVDLYTKFVDLSFKCTLASPFAFKFPFEFINFCLQSALLTIEIFYLRSQLLFIRRRNIKSLYGFLNVFYAPTLFLFKNTPFFIVLLLALFAVTIQAVLVLLFNLQLGQL